MRDVLRRSGKKEDRSRKSLPAAAVHYLGWFYNTPVRFMISILVLRCQMNTSTDLCEVLKMGIHGTYKHLGGSNIKEGRKREGRKSRLTNKDEEESVGGK